MKNTEDYDWDGVLDLIEYEETVPIVGKALLTMTERNMQVTWEQKAVETISARLRIKVPPLSDLPTLANVYLDAPIDRRERLKDRLKKSLADLVVDDDFFPIPDSLRYLAEISHLGLFISTTPDRLLARALVEVRGGSCITRRFGILRDDYGDVPESINGESPTIYHLFGTPEGDTQDFAITEEDMVETLYKLRIPFSDDRLRNLNDHVINSDLMLLGCELPDGIVRPLLRTFARRRFFPAQPSKIADSKVLSDESLFSFVRAFTDDVFDGNPVDFVQSLHDHWRDRFPDIDVRAVSTGNNDKLEVAGKVFISYRRPDQPLVDKIVETLENHGLPVWYDRHDLKPGDDWLHEEKRGLRQSTLFIPVISKNSAVDQCESQREWNIALKVAESMSRDATFIIPICIDETRPGALHIPTEFWNLHVLNCPEGIMSDEHANQIVKKFKDRQLAARDRSR